MTANNITTDALDRIADSLAAALHETIIIRQMARKGEINPEQAAKEINRIGVKLEKALYPEDNK